MLKALADPNRLRIVTLLATGRDVRVRDHGRPGPAADLVFPPPARAAGGWPGLRPTGAVRRSLGSLLRWSRMPVASAATALGEVLDAATIESECRAAACPSRSTGFSALGRD